MLDYKMHILKNWFDNVFIIDAGKDFFMNHNSSVDTTINNTTYCITIFKKGYFISKGTN